MGNSCQGPAQVNAEQILVIKSQSGFLSLNLPSDRNPLGFKVETQETPALVLKGELSV